MTMNCLVVAATVMEITPFLEQYRAKKNMPPGIEIDVLITGIGLTVATYSLAKQLNIKSPDTIIQVGVGGCFAAAIPPEIPCQLITVAFGAKPPSKISSQPMIDLPFLFTNFSILWIK